MSSVQPSNQSREPSNQSYFDKLKNKMDCVKNKMDSDRLQNVAKDVIPFIGAALITPVATRRLLFPGIKRALKAGILEKLPRSNQLNPKKIMTARQFKIIPSALISASTAQVLKEMIGNDDANMSKCKEQLNQLEIDLKMFSQRAYHKYEKIEKHLLTSQAEIFEMIDQENCPDEQKITKKALCQKIIEEKINEINKRKEIYKVEWKSKKNAEKKDSPKSGGLYEYFIENLSEIAANTISGAGIEYSGQCSGMLIKTLMLYFPAYASAASNRSTGITGSEFRKIVETFPQQIVSQSSVREKPLSPLDVSPYDVNGVKKNLMLGIVTQIVQEIVQDKTGSALAAALIGNAAGHPFNMSQKSVDLYFQIIEKEIQATVPKLYNEVDEVNSSCLELIEVLKFGVQNESVAPSKELDNPKPRQFRAVRETQLKPLSLESTANPKLSRINDQFSQFLKGKSLVNYSPVFFPRFEIQDTYPSASELIELMNEGSLEDAQELPSEDDEELPLEEPPEEHPVEGGSDPTSVL
jgi:hypothetical protein